MNNLIPFPVSFNLIRRLLIGIQQKKKGAAGTIGWIFSITLSGF
jgi:hypothetical protein